MKKIDLKRITRKIFGAFISIIAALLFLLLLFVLYVFAGRWGELDLAAFAAVVLIQLLLMTAGVLLFRWEQYVEKHRERAARREVEQGDIRRQREIDEKRQKEEAFAREQAAKRARVLELRKQKEELAKREAAQEAEKRKLLDIPHLQTRHRAVRYLNRNAGVPGYAALMLCLVLAAGSVVIIPGYTAKLEPPALIYAACIQTVVFWIGFIGFFGAWAAVRYSDVEAFFITNERILYYVHFTPLQHKNTAVTKLGQFIGNMRIIEENAVVYEKRRQYLRSDAMMQMLERVINEEGEAKQDCEIVRLNSPRILRTGLSAVSIRYWDEETEKWEKVRIKKVNEGYEPVCELVKNRMDRYL